MVKLKGNEYEVEINSELHLLPLLEILGNNIPTQDDGPEYRAWAEGMMSRFADPANQARLAYCLTAIVPEIPRKIARYSITKTEDGDRIDFYLGINVQEFQQLLADLTPKLQAMLSKGQPKPVSADPDRKTRKKGFSKK